jgi:hypothetical protein
MSFILDALKKSEIERQQQGPSDFANVPSSAESPRAPRWLWVLALLLAVNLAVLLGVFLRDDAPEIVPPSGQASLARPEPAAGASFSERIEEARERDTAASGSAAASPEPVAQPPVETPASEVSSAAPPQPRPRTEFTLAALPTADGQASRKIAPRRGTGRTGNNAGRRHSRLRRNPFPAAARVSRAATIERTCIDTTVRRQLCQRADIGDSSRR